MDRYIHSSIAYQGFGRSLGAENILNIHSLSPLNLLPNITFYLDIDFDTSIKRQAERGNKKDYFESEQKDFYQKVIKGFNFCDEYFDNTFITINAKLSPDKVSEQIIAKLEDK